MVKFFSGSCCSRWTIAEMRSLSSSAGLKAESAWRLRPTLASTYARAMNAKHWVGLLSIGNALIDRYQCVIDERIGEFPGLGCLLGPPGFF